MLHSSSLGVSPLYGSEWVVREEEEGGSRVSPSSRRRLTALSLATAGWAGRYSDEGLTSDGQAVDRSVRRGVGCVAKEGGRV